MKAVGSTFAISVNAGLPDIQGRPGFRMQNYSLTSGAFGVSQEQVLNHDYTMPSSYTSQILGFQASNFNKIYGSSNTVTPLSKSALYILKY